MKIKMKKVLALLLSLSLVLATFGDFAQVKAETTDYQNVTLTSLHGNTAISSTEVQLWINFTGGTWSDWSDWAMQWNPFFYEVNGNGVQKKVNIVQSAGANLLYVTMPISDVPTEEGTKITIKAGEYAVKSGTSTGMRVVSDFEIVLTSDGPVADTGYKIFDVGSVDIAYKTANEIIFDLKDKEGNAITFGKYPTEGNFPCTLVPAKQSGSRMNSATEWELSKNGVFQGESHINYWPSGNFNFIEMDTGRFKIGGLNATEGTVVTVKGAFAAMDGDTWVDFDKCIFKEFSFTYTGDTWVFSKPYQDITLTGVFGNTTITDTEVQLWMNLSSDAWSADDWTDWSSQWCHFVYEINGVNKEVAIVQAAGTNLLYVTIPIEDVLTEEGTKITIKAGAYPAYMNTDMGINLLNNFEIVFTCDGPVADTGYKIFDVGSVDIAYKTANEIIFDLKDKEGNAITFGKYPTEGNFPCTLVPANQSGSRMNSAAEWELSKNGVFQGESHINYWPSGNFNFIEMDTGRFKIGGLNATEGTVVTVKGAFAAMDGDTWVDFDKCIFKEFSFTYTNDAWVSSKPSSEPTYTEYTGTPVLSETSSYGSAAGFYFTSEDGAPYAADWSLHSTALDGDGNGVFVNGTKTTCVLKKNGANIWYADISGAGITLNAGDVVTIKGTFQHGNDTVTFNEASFEFNGKRFGEGEFTATDFTITGLAYSDIVYDEANSRWNMYFTLSTNIPGDIDTTYYPYMSYEIDGTEYTTHWFKSSSAHTVDGEVIYNLYFPIEALPQTLTQEYAITVKAGASQGRVLGTNVARTDGINLTADYQFVVGGDYEASAPTINYTMENGGNANGIYLSSQDTFPTIGWDYSLTKAGAEDGIYIYNASTKEFETTDVFIKKYEANKYYVCLSDGGKVASEGTIVMLRGAFTTAKLNTVTFKTAKYIYTDGQWNIYSTTVEVDSTGVDGDAIGNSDLNSADLIRIKRYLKGLEDEIGVVDADLNGTGNVDEKDIVLERKLLIGLIDENGAHIKGAPTYSDTTEEMRLAAYVSPTVEEGFDDYKAAGFTTLISEQKAVYGTDGFADYMNLATEKGLDVLVQSGYMQGMFDGTEEFDTNWLSTMYNDLSQYESFRGMYMADEPVIANLENYTKVANALKSLDPDMDLFTSCHPLYVPNETYLSTDTSLDLYEKYTNYAKSYGDVFNEFTYDFYPFRYQNYKEWDWSKLGYTYYEGNYMRSDWFNNLTIAASTARGLYDTGITVQSYANTYDQYGHYRDLSEADISFQVYSALAYGMKSINYFTYGTHWDSSVGTTNCMVLNGEKTSLYTAVQNVNKEIKALDHMLLNYTWQGTIGITGDNEDGLFNYADYYKYDSKRISASSASNDAIIGCLRDVDGYDGFMLVNATDPSDNITETITVTFKSADHAKVYIDGVESIVELTNGTYSATLNPGQGIFVIPYIAE